MAESAPPQRGQPGRQGIAAWLYNDAVMLDDAAVSRLPMSVDNHKLQEFCERWGVTELDLFGSVLRDYFRADSDIDVLVTLAADRKPTFFTLVQMENQLRSVFGRSVDLALRRSV